MKGKKKKVLILLGAIILLVSPVFSQSWRVDDSGNITRDGQIFRIKGGNWFGLEGRHEPSNDPNNPSGAPMEMYIGNVWWASSSRTYQGDADEFASMGINTIRVPLVHQTLDNNDPQGRTPYLKNTESVRINGARSALEKVIQVCDSAGIYVILDIHSCNNYIGWRAGRLDDHPPWVDANRDNYDFTREDYACDGSGNESSAYNTSVWTQDLRTLAGLGQSIGCDNVMGIDIFNEPYDYSWSEWRSLIDQAYSAINGANSNILVFAGGIGSFNNKNTTNAETPNGDPDLNPNWGENLFEAGDNPPTMPKNRLVYAPHTYGPSVYQQIQFMDPNQPECEGLEGDEAGDAECNIVIRPEYISQGWEEHFGYLKDLGYAIAINEWGGNPNWPDGAEPRMQDRFGYLTDKTIDWQWQTALVDYMISKGICDSCYWSINPESGDTGGLFIHAYDPYNNTGGWGTWNGQDSKKLGLLNRLWTECSSGSTPIPSTPTPTPVSDTPTPTPVGDTPTPTPVSDTPTPVGDTPTPTPVGDTPTPTPGGGTCNVSFDPANSTQGVNSTFNINVVVNSGSQNVAAYGFTITYSSSVLSVTAVEEGADGFLAAANTSNPGEIVASGFDASGTGPGSNLQILTITFNATSEGTSTLSVNVDKLVDSDTAVIGAACGVDGSVTVTDVMLGDTNGDGAIDIIDALLTAQYYVDLDPAGFNPGAADTNCDGSIDIVDALLIAQYYVELIDGFCL